jgi:hypothetical protein
MIGYIPGKTAQIIQFFCKGAEFFYLSIVPDKQFDIHLIGNGIGQNTGHFAVEHTAPDIILELVSAKDIVDGAINNDPGENNKTKKNVAKTEDNNNKRNVENDRIYIPKKPVRDSFKSAVKSIDPFDERADKIIAEKMKRMFMEIFKARICKIAHHAGLKIRIAVDRRADREMMDGRRYGDKPKNTEQVTRKDIKRHPIN